MSARRATAVGESHAEGGALGVAAEYRRLVHRLARGPAARDDLKRLSELVSLLEISAQCSAHDDASLGALLLTIMGETQASRGLVLLRDAGAFVPAAARGLRAKPAAIALSDIPKTPIVENLAAAVPVLADLGLQVLASVPGSKGPVGVVALGRTGGRWKTAEKDFLRSAAASIAGLLESTVAYAEVQRLTRRLSLKVYQLRNLFELSRELTSTFDAEAVTSLAMATLMGHLMVSRSALYLRKEDVFVLAHERGSRVEAWGPAISCEDAEVLAGAGDAAVRVRDMPASPLKARLESARMGLVAAIHAGGRCEGLLLTGERASATAFSDEDCDFALTLGRQTLAALDTVRLHRVSLDKERQDRDMEIAREIQRTLFPGDAPSLAGLDVAARSESSQRVGGDYYDVIRLPGGRGVIAVADVSGKGMPASLLMASVHAWLRARAGTADLATLMRDLNRFLFESTLANKFVTFFCAEVDGAGGHMSYVNAGHVPPFFLGSDGREARLTRGGPVLGLLEDAAYEAGRLTLSAGDLVATVTDGATEALSPEEHEFGDDGVWEVLRLWRGRGSREILEASFDAINRWVGSSGLSDDLTALIVRKA